MENIIKPISPRGKKPILNSHEERRKKTLENLLLGVIFFSATMVVFLGLVSLLNPSLFTDLEGGTFLIPSFIVFFGAITIGLISRYISHLVASTIFILLLCLGIVAGDTLDQIFLGRSFVYLILPIVSASLLIHPKAGYVVAFLINVSALISMSVLTIGQPDLPALLFLFFIAFLVQQSTSALEKIVEELQQAKQVLQEKEERFRVLIESSTDITAILGSDSSIDYVSPSVERLLGYKTEEVIGQKIFDYLHPEDANIAYAALKPGIPADAIGPMLVLRLRNKNGSWSTFEVIGEGMNSHPAIMGTVINCRDITERKKIEDELRESEEKLSKAFQLTPAPMALTGLDGRYIEINQAFSRILGYTQEDVYDHLPSEMGIFVDLENSRHATEILQAQGRLDNYELSVQTKSGEIRHGLFFAELLQITNRPLVITMMNDITERKKADSKLRESEEKYHHLIDNLPVGVLIHQEGKIVLCNPESVRLFSAKGQDDLIGTSLIEHVHPDYRKLVQERIKAALTKDISGEIIEEKLLRIDGTTFFADVSGLPFRYGDKTSILVVLTDITERKRAKDAIAIQNQRIQEVSRQLVEVQEREKHLLATELHDDLGQSLTSLKLMLELASGTRSPAARQEGLKNARDVISELMDKVRNLSLDLRPAMLDDFGLFAALRWLFERFLSRTGIAVHCDYDLDSKQRFETHVETAAFRIIQEALTNVARYAGVKETQVTISTGRALFIEIADNGRGFDFSQMTQKETDSAGLSGMEERARLLGGRVEIISDKGTGTRVIAEIPLTGDAQ